MPSDLSPKDVEDVRQRLVEDANQFRSPKKAILLFDQLTEGGLVTPVGRYTLAELSEWAASSEQAFVRQRFELLLREQPTCIEYLRELNQLSAAVHYRGRDWLRLLADLDDYAGAWVEQGLGAALIEHLEHLPAERADARELAVQVFCWRLIKSRLQRSDA